MCRPFSLTFLVLICIHLICVPGISQTTADLLNSFKKRDGVLTDSNQIALTNKLAEKYFYNHPDSAMAFGKTSLRFAKKYDIKIETAKAYNIIAKVYYITGSFFESLSYADSAMAISKQIGFKSGIANAINTRGLIYLGQDRIIDALPEFKKALIINKQLKDSSRIAVNYFNIGLSYDHLHQYENAFANLNKALQIAQACNDGHVGQMVLNRIGETHYHSRNYEQALFYYNSVLSFAAYQDNWERGFAYSGLAQTFYELKEYRQALGYARKSFVLTKELKAKWDIERAATILSKCYAALGDYKQAYTYQSVARAYSDSLLNEKKEREINYLHLREKRAENLELIRENESNRKEIKNVRTIIYLTTLFSIALVILLVLLRRNIAHKNALNKALQESNNEIRQQKDEIQAQQEELVTLNKTKDRILSVIGHDLRSPFASIIQALEMIRSGDLNKHDQFQLFEEFHRQVSLVFDLINNLLMWANSQKMGVITKYEKVDLTQASENVLSLYKSSALQKKQRLLHHFEDTLYIEADENHVRIILQNIISNAIKFTPDHGTIALFYTTENNFIAIHIQDNGRGMSVRKLTQLFQSAGRAISENGTNNEPGTGLGLLLIKQFIEENKGRIEVRSEEGKGCEFIVYFKAYLYERSSLGV
ncbi:tetratricopeptide repeat protein [Larkinella bovis]|uniref:histidine kinase n=1 Tax=Larkinella bovis TaxID=683041 RepID=A0ABW0IKZ3_9BACT